MGMPKHLFTLVVMPEDDQPIAQCHLGFTDAGIAVPIA
jgi:hypothetical protein